MAVECSAHCPWIRILKQPQVTPWIAEPFGLSGVGLTQMYQDAQNLEDAVKASENCSGPVAAMVEEYQGGFFGLGGKVVRVPGFLCGLHSGVGGV